MSAAIGNVRLVPMGTRARIILSDEALATIAEVLEDAAHAADTYREEETLSLLAEIIRQTVPEGVLMDLPIVDEETGERDGRTRALLKALAWEERW